MYFKHVKNISARKIPIRSIVITATMAALSSVLMTFGSFPLPLVPGFIKMDFSELPALITSFSLGPVYGVLVCLIKNLFHLLSSDTSGVGEISNFLLGVCFVLPAGLIYKKLHSFKGAVIGSLVGNVSMAVISLPINYFLIYPIYTKFMPMEAILGAYKAILPGDYSLLEALMIFNMPFTFVKGLFSAIITFLIYKRISPLLKGRKKQA